MSKEIVVQPQPRAWLEDSVLQPYVSRYGAHLRRGRYAPSTQRIYLCCVAHFAHWLTGEQYGLNAIGEAVVACFLSEHMPACACPYPVRRLRHELRAALAQLLEVLRADGVGTLDPALDTVVSQELARFDAHMRDVWGLADTTRLRRGRVVDEFLLAHFGDQPITMSTIGAASVRRFVLGEQGRSAGSIGVIGGAIGCYIRFRSMSGDRVSELAAAIPRAAHWRLASLPEVLTDAEIDELLRSFNQSFPSRRRAYAMVRCLIDLGLRCSEVIKLRLEDINWADGTITLVGTKGRRADVLPLPAATGSAIAAYLHEERPQTLNRAIFVRHVAPYDEPIEKGAVKRAVVAGYRRCGWTRTGVHILRHSVASRLLRTGAPMKDIADVLRHRCLDTSAIYRQGRSEPARRRRLALAGERVMIEVRTMLSLAEDYLTERRALGFDLRIPGDQITAFARFVDGAAHTGPLTTRITLDWVQGQAKHAVPFSWARRLDVLRPFARYLTRLDPATEFPQTAIFGRSHRRLAPHIYSEQEICDLLAAARRLAPHGRLRPATYETIFGLIAATGLRLSEALHLQCGNVDLDQGVLTVRNTKFRKSRHVPMHATAVAALDRYMAVRARHGATNRDSFLFLSSSGGPLPTRTIHWVFQKLRAELGWTARGAYAHARIHDLRHTFICRRVQLWHEHGADIDNAMAALSTYVGHAKVSDTYWYLTGVPDLMAVTGKRFELFAAAVGGDHHA